LQACGLSTLNRSAEDYGLGLTIGNAEARLLELANAYACLARLGQYRPYQLLLHGARPYRVPPTQEGVGRESISPRVNPESQPVADSGAAYLIADILSDNAARTLAFGAETPLRFEFPVACKTGTRSDFRDNWAFGYTPEFTVGVWVGNFDGAPMQQVSGITGAGPILHDVFDHLHSQFGTTWYPIPKDLVECPIHPLTGHRLAGPPASQPATTEKFLASDLPSLETPDDYAVVRRPNATQPARLQLPIILGPEYRAWSASADNWLAGATVLAEAPASLHITFPLPGTTFYLDPDLPHQGRRLCLQSDGLQTVRWQSDSLRIENEGPRPIALLSEGRHRLLVTDRISGAEARTWIEVLSR
jgi:penicillin-binding protein 1C